MRISDWSSDVCSSDLDRRHRERFQYIDDSFGRAIAPLAVVAGKGGDRALAILGAEIDEHQQCRPDVQRVGERRGERAVEEAAQKAGIDQAVDIGRQPHRRSEEHTSELQSLMRISYAVFCLKKKKEHDYIIA